MSIKTERDTMAFKLPEPRRRDDRIARALADPKAYFAEARARARREVAAEIAQERRPQGRRKRT
jgi:hypothetical protein